MDEAQLLKKTQELSPYCFHSKFGLLSTCTGECHKRSRPQLAASLPLVLSQLGQLCDSNYATPVIISYSVNCHFFFIFFFF
jgi:hypothetical protein